MSGIDVELGYVAAGVAGVARSRSVTRLWARVDARSHLG